MRARLRGVEVPTGLGYGAKKAVLPANRGAMSLAKLILVLLSLCSPSIARAQQPIKSQLLDIGGRRLFITCQGEVKRGQPIVILDSGLGSDSTAWNLVQPKVAKFARVCSYDRAGLGQSDKAPKRGDGDRIIGDLHRLLVAANIQPPFVLVGHSLGGVNCRRYAVEYSRDVVGMVFVDSANENEIPRTWEIFREVKGREPTPEEKQLLGDEDLDFEQVSEQARHKRWEGDIPLIVLTRDSSKAPSESEMSRRMQALRKELQADLVKRSKLGEQRVIPGAGHDIQLDNPAAVVKAIRDIVERTSKKQN
jgi:pimeloyl-ACP methyl ester carboxylesterase